MKKTIYILGNSITQGDSIPLKLQGTLQKKFPQFNFINLDPTEEITDNENGLIIIDAVSGIKDVKVFRSTYDFKLSPNISLHDFDLPLQLGMMLKLKKIKSFMIIGVPQKGNTDDLIRKTGNILKSTLS